MWSRVCRFIQVLSSETLETAAIPVLVLPVWWAQIWRKGLKKQSLRWPEDIFGCSPLLSAPWFCSLLPLQWYDWRASSRQLWGIWHHVCGVGKEECHSEQTHTGAESTGARIWYSQCGIHLQFALKLVFWCGPRNGKDHFPQLQVMDAYALCLHGMVSRVLAWHSSSCLCNSLLQFVILMNLLQLPRFPHHHPQMDQGKLDRRIRRFRPDVFASPRPGCGLDFQVQHV